MEHPVVAEVSEFGVTINGTLLHSSIAPDVLTQVVGATDRVQEPAIPAPYGYRNNQIHTYDSVGVYAIEHHATRLITSIDFVLDNSHSPFPILASFTGKLSIYDVDVSLDKRLKAYPEEWLSRFELRLGSFVCREGACSVILDASPSERRRGRRKGRLSGNWRFVSAAIGLQE